MKSISFALLLLSLVTWSAKGFSLEQSRSRYVIEFDHPLSASEIMQYSKSLQGDLSRLSLYPTSYFSRAYVIETEFPISEIQKTIGVQTVETVIQIETQSVIPTNTPSHIGNDPFANYQWGLENTGQDVTYDIDDITIRTREGKAGIDIGLSGLKDLDNQIKMKVLVAVIDSGVDLDHPELKNHFYTNDAECIKGEIPLNPKEDKDGNGYVGDCKGWDFTGKKKEGSNRQIDDLGHGTHVAGIIAAEANDETGIRGVSNQIQILPLKVLSGDSEKKNAVGFSDRLTRAILYAVEKKVSVINLSLGWPLYMDRKHLREAIEAAQKAGILIVAASGNNNHGAPLLPCAIREVLCVGSINNDGSVSGFSNFGAHVDVLAPGDNILSTIPRALKSLHFPIVGYDYKSGTSQAAPFVSGIAASLMGLFPNKTPSQIRSLIISTAQPLNADQLGQKYFRSGLVRLDRAISQRIHYPVTLDYKESERNAIWKDTDKSLRLKIPLQNHSGIDLSGQIQIQSDSSLTFEKTTIPFHIKANSDSEFDVQAKLLNVSMDRIQKLIISITTPNQTLAQTYDLELLRDAHAVQNALHLPLDYETSSQIYSLKRFGAPSPTPRYYEITQADNNTLIRILSIGASKINVEQTVDLRDIERILQIRELDVDGDQDLDLQIIALMKPKDENSEKTIRYIHRELIELKKSNGLFIHNNAFQEMTLNVESVLEIENELNHLLISSPDTQIYAAPFFLANGLVPQLDQPKDHFEGRITTEGPHLYYFEPELKANKWNLRTRIVDAPDRVKKWKKDLGLKPFQDLSILHILPQSNAETLQLLVTTGSGYLRTTYIAHLQMQKDEPFIQWQAITTDVVVDGYALDKTMHLSDSNRTDVALIGQVNDTTWVKSYMGESGISSISLKSDDSTETINTYIQSYSKNNFHFSFLQTVSELLFTVESNDSVRAFRTPFHVSTFLPGQIYQEKAWAIWHGQSLTKKPALYVDATQILARSAYLVVGDESGLKTPANMSLHIPKECVANNPSLWNDEQYQFTLLCRVNDHFEFRFIPMK